MITYRELENNLIRGHVSNFYLLVSKDYYRVSSILKKFSLMLKSDLNFNCIEANSIEDFTEVENMCNTFPLFDTKRVIVISGLDFKKHSDILDKILKYLPKMPVETIMILTHYVTDNRENYKKNKTVLKVERVRSNSVIYQPQITLDDVRRVSKELGINLNNNILNILAGSDNLDIVVNDIKKISFLDDMSESKVKEVLSGSNEIDVFNLTDALKNRNLREALEFVKKIKDKGDTDIGINCNLISTLKLLLDCKMLLDTGLNEDEVAKNLVRRKLAKSEYPVILACKQCFKFTTDNLIKSIELCKSFDIEFKRGKKSDISILLIKILAI